MSEELKVPMASSDELAGARHVLHYDRRRTGEKARDMPLHEPRVAIDPTAGRHADNDLDGLVAERRCLGMHGCRCSEEE